MASGAHGARRATSHGVRHCAESAFRMFPEPRRACLPETRMPRRGQGRYDRSLGFKQGSLTTDADGNEVIADEWDPDAY